MPEWTKKNFDDLRGDNEAGLTLGRTVGAMAVDRFASGATAAAVSFDSRSGGRSGSSPSCVA
jgi:hypothetical protein